MGILRVDLLDGSDIRGVDRSGKSDPYAVFTLNGDKVYKSQIIKKTLAPQWNEDFSCNVVSSFEHFIFLKRNSCDPFTVVSCCYQFFSRDF